MKSSSRFFVVLFVPLAVATIYFLGVRPRLHASAVLAGRTNDRVSVNVITVTRATASTELLLPASLRAFEEASIYARTNGYVQRWIADIGDRVKAGETLAIIEAPEVDQELAQVQAALQQARANVTLARNNATRWNDLGKEKAVAQQEIDEKVATLGAREADVSAAEANVARLIQLKHYQTITAPFDGVVSARNIDIGSLITAGSGGRELYRISQTTTLRVYANVPQAYVRSVKPGLEAEVMLGEFPGKTFVGKVVRIAGTLDATSRTLLTEVELDNSNGELLAGMFGQVRFRLTPGEPPVLIPSNAVMVRADGVQVVTLGAGNTLHYQKVKIGRDFGTQLEILSGLDEGTRIVANPNDGLTEGLPVDPMTAEKKI